MNVVANLNEDEYPVTLSVDDFDLEKISSTTTQIQLEKLFSKYQLIPSIKQEFIEAGFMEELKKHQLHVEFGLTALAQIYLHKRASFSTLGGLLIHFFEEMEEIDNPAQRTADELTELVKQDFFDWNPVSREFVLRYRITDDIQRKLDLYQYPLPMIEEPTEVVHNRQSGWKTTLNNKSIILRDNHTNDDVCLDHINRVNRVPLKLNMDTVAFVQNSWANLDHQKPDEDHADYQRRVRAFEKYDIVSRDVLKAISMQGDRFWLTHRYDFRGRTYAQGYHINYQGNDWNKACIELADGETLN